LFCLIQFDKAQSTPCAQNSYTGVEVETPGSIFLPPDLYNIDDTISSEKSSDTPLEHLNNFLTSRSISPIRTTLRTPWDEASERTKNRHMRKARQALSAVLDEVAPTITSGTTATAIAAASVATTLKL